MTIREEVQKILDKGYSEYTYEDIDQLSKLKMKVGSKVATAKINAEKANQIYRNNRSKTALLLAAEGGSYEKAKDSAFVTTHEERLKLIELEAEYEELKNYYNDLNDCLISVRQNVKAFDYENNKSLANNNG